MSGFKPLPKGCWPTMITPFTDSGEIDWPVLKELTEWCKCRPNPGLCLGRFRNPTQPACPVAAAEVRCRCRRRRRPDIASGCSGLFAVCQSSEMFYLSDDERIELAQFVATQAAGRVAVVATGNSDGGDMAAQVGIPLPRIDSRLSAAGAPIHTCRQLVGCPQLVGWLPAATHRTHRVCAVPPRGLPTQAAFCNRLAPIVDAVVILTCLVAEVSTG